MPGRPRTKHKKIVAILKRLEAIENQMIFRLLPDQYAEASDDDHSLPYDDLGRCWRQSVEAVTSAVMQFEWLECLLGQKAKQAEQCATADEAEELDDLDDQAEDQPATAQDVAAEGEARDAAQATPDADDGQQEPTEPAAAEDTPESAASESAPG